LRERNSILFPRVDDVLIMKVKVVLVNMFSKDKLNELVFFSCGRAKTNSLLEIGRVVRTINLSINIRSTTVGKSPRDSLTRGYF
jgi:hypothetical protein